MTIHPKTGGAALGAALGTAIVAILGSIHGINLSSTADGAITGFLSTLGAFLFPAPDNAVPTAFEIAKEILNLEAKK